MGRRLNKVLSEFNIGTETVVKFLKSIPGLEPTKEMTANTKVTDEQYAALRARFKADKAVKDKADSIFPQLSKDKKPSLSITNGDNIDIKVVGKVDLDSLNQSIRPKKMTYEDKEAKRRSKRAEWLSKVRSLQEKLDKEHPEESNKVIISQITCTIKLTQLRFNKDYFSYRRGNDIFVFHYPGFSSELNKYKYHSSIKDVSTEITLDYSNGTFTFVTNSILQKLESFKTVVENEIFEKHLKEEQKRAQKEKKKEKRVEKESKIERHILFSALNFGHKSVSFRYKGIRYVYRDYNIRNYDAILEHIYKRVSKGRKNTIKTSLLKVVIDTETETFIFKDVDIIKYVNNLKDSFLPENENTEVQDKTLFKANKITEQKVLPTTKTMKLKKGNIHFYNGYFLIFQTIDGVIDNTVTPYRVDDSDSHEILNLVHNYFEQRFEQMRIIVKHDDTKIFEPSKPDLFQLKNYVRALRRNLDVKGEWWEEVQNAQKRSFRQCFGESRDCVKSKYVKSKNEYLYNLSALQNEKKLICVYEVNHGKEEDAFIFTISMSNNRCAIIFENASNDAFTTTWVFVAKNEDYESCINLVFNYFADYTISAKRSSLRDANTNPPFKFKAESYTFIDHNDLGQWLKKLDKVLERTSQTSNIAFVPGLNIPQSSGTRTNHSDVIPTKNLHNQLMCKLYERLCEEHGKERVGTEIRVGAKRIDTVVQGNGFYDIYEVKTATNPFDCVTEALGQLCQYAYLFCRDKIGKMVIVGASETNREVEQYLSWFRQKHSMEVYYMQVTI